MSVEHKRLRCGFCGHEWRALWDMGSHLQTAAVKTCPQCRQPAARLASTELFEENAFEVRIDPEGDVMFSIPGLRGTERLALDATLPRDYAINLAAWLAKVADADGDFRELCERIKRR